MALPILKHPTYKIKLPSNNKELKFRPFLVGEEKILLMAMESKNANEIVMAIEQIVKSCSISKIKVSEMPILDVEYFFLHLRAKSKGEVLELKYMCTNCDKPIDFELNIDNVKVKKNKNHNKKIPIDGDIGMVMKYPTMAIANIITEAEEVKNKVESQFNIIKSCIDYVYDNEEIHKFSDQTEEEVDEFINNLSEKPIVEATNFLNTMPEVVYEDTLTCDNCSTKNDVLLKGLQNFFV